MDGYLDDPGFCFSVSVFESRWFCQDGEIFAIDAGLPPPSLRRSDEIKGSLQLGEVSACPEVSPFSDRQKAKRADAGKKNENLDQMSGLIQTHAGSESSGQCIVPVSAMLQ